MRIQSSLLLFIAAVFFSSCNMGKYYAYQRIDHPEQDTENIETGDAVRPEKEMAIHETVSLPKETLAEIITDQSLPKSKRSIQQVLTKSLKTKPVHFLSAEHSPLKKPGHGQDIQKHKEHDPGYFIVMISSLVIFTIGFICLLAVAAPLGHILFYIFTGIAIVILAVYIVQMVTV